MKDTRKTRKETMTRRGSLITGQPRFFCIKKKEMKPTIEDMKRQCRIPEDWTEDDALLERYAEIAIAEVATRLCSTPDEIAPGGDVTDPVAYKAVMMLVATYYDNRATVSPVRTYDVAEPVQSLLNLIRDYSR